jgi:hypothetical protein
MIRRRAFHIAASGRVRLIDQQASQAAGHPANCRATLGGQSGPRKNWLQRGKKAVQFDTQIATIRIVPHDAAPVVVPTTRSA